MKSLQESIVNEARRAEYTVAFLGFNDEEGLPISARIPREYAKEFDKFLANGLMQKTQNGIKLTQKGILISNEILCDFIQLND